MLITLALYHRDSLSHGNSRRIFGYEAYHWGLLFFTPNDTTTTTTDVYSFDATDASDIDPVTFRLRNPTMDWWLRAETNPPANPKLIGQLVVGTVADDAAPGFEELKGIFAQVPLPVKNTHPQQSCVTWAVSAIGRLQTQDAGWVPRGLDLGGLKDAALAYADERMKKETTEPTLKHYEA